MSETTYLDIWTDGACKHNPGIGGWGVLMIYGPHRREWCGGEELTTNNRMELIAVIEALKKIKRPVPIRIHLDSKYVHDGIAQWIAGWKKKGWRTAAGKPVKNMELWQELDALVHQHQIEWCWVKGHAGDPGNEKADELANQGVEQIKARQKPA